MLPVKGNSIITYPAVNKFRSLSVKKVQKQEWECCINPSIQNVHLTLKTITVTNVSITNIVILKTTIKRRSGGGGAHL